MIDAFLKFARERHSIYLRRRDGLPRSEWTDDQILQTYRFTNVFRELDRTTVWFRDHVREPMRDSPEVLLATVLFRWFNRIGTGEAIFTQPDLLGGDTAWFMAMTELYMNNGRVDQDHGSAIDPIRSAILSYCKNGPYVTGAYIIKTPNGMSKLDGVLWCVEQFMKGHRRDGRLTDPWLEKAGRWLTHNGSKTTLEEAWLWLRGFPFMGDFMAYEVVTDLRHTDLLCRAPDINTWANPGPGAARGLSRIRTGDATSWRPGRDQLIREMQELLRPLREALLDLDTPHIVEMREVEHTLCEFDKYERVRLGEGRPRGRFR